MRQFTQSMRTFLFARMNARSSSCANNAMLRLLRGGKGSSSDTFKTFLLLALRVRAEMDERNHFSAASLCMC